VRVGIPNLRESGGSTLQGELGARGFWLCVCGPFVARGAKGKKSTPSIGWEVPVKSQRLASGQRKGTPVAKDCHQAYLRRSWYFHFEFALY
jgi:hypothetical protein